MYAYMYLYIVWNMDMYVHIQISSCPEDSGTPQACWITDQAPRARLYNSRQNWGKQTCSSPEDGQWVGWN